MSPDAPIDLPTTLPGRVEGDLLLGSPVPVVLALGVAVVLLVHARRAHRGPTRRRTAAAVGGASALVALAAVLGVNLWVGYLPSVQTAARWVQTRTWTPHAKSPEVPAPPHARDPRHGRVLHVTVPSTSPGVPDSPAWVYLPPQYDRPGSTARFPVVYALHGAPGTAADWFAGGRADATVDELVATGHLPPVVVVAPDLNAGAAPAGTEPLDVPGGPQLGTYLRTDVVAWADRTLRTRDEPAGRLVVGMSAGSLGALVTGLGHPDVFGGVVALMPYAAPDTPAVVADPRAAERSTPTSVLRRRDPATVQPVFLGVPGAESPAAEQALARALRDAHQPTTLRVYPGLGHTWVGARTMLPYGLVWCAGQLGWVAP
ncbi:alpha/beta hydrolase [Cellulomonas iranensis]|uniref:alpha/beta hydrolase n=1 Tax=Cellulomonas iranensis TaxID=76862 RepID=UPI000B3C5C12|nr:alpha/beta hydrolase-fold protein [Cellulomonas iranensis]